MLNENKARLSVPRLSTLRKQDLELTEGLDRTLETQLLEFYNGVYMLEVTDDPKVLSRYVERYISSIKYRNETQGKGGVYSGYDVFEIEVIRRILLAEGFHGLLKLWILL